MAFITVIPAFVVEVTLMIGDTGGCVATLFPVKVNIVVVNDRIRLLGKRWCRRGCGINVEADIVAIGIIAVADKNRVGVRAVAPGASIESASVGAAAGVM